ncbi:MAG: hypothetical protein MZW92_68235 [Comamonadaceae bacterium]|nr:hypothetical protein [Comamonadaceae bacterium]
MVRLTRNQPSWHRDARRRRRATASTQTVTRLEQADQGITAWGWWRRRGASRAAAGRGVEIPGNAVLMVFRNDYAVRMLQGQRAGRHRGAAAACTSPRTPTAAPAVSYRTPSARVRAVRATTELDALAQRTRPDLRASIARDAVGGLESRTAASRRRRARERSQVAWPLVAGLLAAVARRAARGARRMAGRRCCGWSASLLGPDALPPRSASPAAYRRHVRPARRAAACRRTYCCWRLTTLLFAPVLAGGHAPSASRSPVPSPPAGWSVAGRRVPVRHRHATRGRLRLGHALHRGRRQPAHGPDPGRILRRVLLGQFAHGLLAGPAGSHGAVSLGEALGWPLALLLQGR